MEARVVTGFGFEHLEQRPQVYLSAHLNSVEAGILKERGEIRSGSWPYGNTASTGIPRSNTFILRLVCASEQFPKLVFCQNSERNEHGVWNGMNMVGLDVLDLFKA